MQKTLRLPVSKESFERIIKGEQNIIYRTYGDFWLKKLYNTRTFKCKIDYMVITSGIGEDKSVVRVKVLGVKTQQQGKTEWDAPKGKVFALYFERIIEEPCE